MASVLSSNLLFHCFVRDFIQDNGVCNVLNETEIVANFCKARVRGTYGDQFCRFLDHNFGKYRRLLQSCFSRNRSFQRYRYSKCHISGSKLNVDGIEVSSFCSECALFRPLASDALQRYRNAILRNCNAIFDFQITLFTAILTFLIT